MKTFTKTQTNMNASSTPWLPLPVLSLSLSSLFPPRLHLSHLLSPTSNLLYLAQIPVRMVRPPPQELGRQVASKLQPCRVFYGAEYD